MSCANPRGVTAQGEANCAWSTLNTANNVNFLVLAKTTAQARLPAGDRLRVKLIAASSLVLSDNSAGKLQVDVAGLTPMRAKGIILVVDEIMAESAEAVYRSVGESSNADERSNSLLGPEIIGELLIMNPSAPKGIILGRGGVMMSVSTQFKDALENYGAAVSARSGALVSGAPRLASQVLLYADLNSQELRYAGRTFSLTPAMSLVHHETHPCGGGKGSSPLLAATSPGTAQSHTTGCNL